MPILFRPASRRAVLAALAVLAPSIDGQCAPLAVAPAPAASAAAAPPSPVLDRLRQGGTLVLAHRESSVPFSYLDADKKPVGYALDLCLKFAEAIRKELGLKTLVQLRAQEKVRQLKGRITWEGDLNAMRTDK